MTHVSPSAFDLIVVGGGPGGSSLAAFVAMDGHKVLLLERERFPRYQIGESLLPSTVHGICKMLGVWDEVEAANFTRKRGGTFRWGAQPEPWTFAFSSSSAMHGAGYAYQVERMKFDAILLNNARRRGVEVREQCSVLDLLREGDRVVGVRYQDADGKTHEVRAAFVADASGNQSHLYAPAGERVYSKFFQNVALFTYFENGKRLPPPNSGNILCVAFAEGWFWYIPLSPTLTSVGVVIAREHADRLKQGHEEAMRGFVEACPLIKEYLANATRVAEGPYGQFRVRKDYSYCNERFWSPGFVVIGDAACFIDPVFSSGVHLATYSALLAARSVSTSLRGEIGDARCFGEFERRYRREYGLFYDFLVSFYDMHQDVDSYYWSARKVLSTEEIGNDAFIRIVGGVGAGPEEFFAERANLGASAAALVASAGHGEPPLAETVAAAGRALRLDERFVETVRIMEHAAGAARGAETPLFERGLIPTTDGLRWCEAAAS